MSGKTRILLTGAAGYIGAAIGTDLEAAGYEVVGVTRRGMASAPESAEQPAAGSMPNAKSTPESGSASPESLRSGYRSRFQVRCDLSDAVATRRALAEIPACDVIVHTASRTDSARDAIAASTAMLRNLFDATRHWDARWIHLSSVAVYGDDRRNGPVSVDADLRPATNYGRAKLACERFLRQCQLPDCRILRITPVYSPNALRNLAVRVYLPGTPLRMKIRPEPRHSLCALDRLIARVRNHVEDARVRIWIENTADPVPHGQHELARRFDRGPLIPISERIFRLIYVALALIPGGGVDQLRCVYWKLFRSNVYETPGQALD